MYVWMNGRSTAKKATEHEWAHRCGSVATSDNITVIPSPRQLEGDRAWGLYGNTLAKTRLNLHEGSSQVGI